MSELDKVKDKVNINLNQNLWGGIFAFTSLGLAEYFKLKILCYFALALSFIMLVSLIFSTYAYTLDYYKNTKKMENIPLPLIIVAVFIIFIIALPILVHIGLPEWAKIP